MIARKDLGRRLHFGPIEVGDYVYLEQDDRYLVTGIIFLGMPIREATLKLELIES